MNTHIAIIFMYNKILQVKNVHFKVKLSDRKLQYLNRQIEKRR